MYWWNARLIEGENQRGKKRRKGVGKWNTAVNITFLLHVLRFRLVLQLVGPGVKGGSEGWRRSKHNTLNGGNHHSSLVYNHRSLGIEWEWIQHWMICLSPDITPSSQAACWSGNDWVASSRILHHPKLLHGPLSHGGESQLTAPELGIDSTSKTL